MLLLTIWLIVSGLAAFIPALGGLGVILAILANGGSASSSCWAVRSM